MKKIRTELIFAAVAAAGLCSTLMVAQAGLTWLPLLVISLGLIVWAISQNDQDGFIKIKGMPRAGDPVRNFHPMQSLVLVLILLAQVIVSSYLVLLS